MSLIPYTKPAISISDQLVKLTTRGLAIPDPVSAEHYLKHIGYYRLTGYGLSFFDRASGRYDAGRSFQDLLDHYIFDRELRVMVMDEIERIEIAVRSIIVNELSLKHGPHWHLNHKLFIPKKDALQFGELLRKVEAETGRSKERFIFHYRNKYSDPYLPPAWMAAECLSFGIWSRIYAVLARADRLPIARAFGLHEDEMQSFVHSLTVVRNVCAHHARLFDRTFSHRPTTTWKLNGVYPTLTQDSFYARAALIHVFLNVILPVNHWPQKLVACFRKHPGVNPSVMGFPTGWESQPFWQATGIPATALAVTPTTHLWHAPKRPQRTRLKSN